MKMIKVSQKPRSGMGATGKGKDLTEMMDETIAANLKALERKKPLVHIITHQIAANDTANCLLAIGARPIMAEHPLEVAEIVTMSAALGVSLGNINESRLKAIEIAGETAFRQKKPGIIDCVGVGASRLRLDFAREYIAAWQPAIVKGNASELLALAGCNSHAAGVDAGAEDDLCPQSAEQQKKPREIEELRRFAQKNNTVVVVTGERDLVTDGENMAIVSNGDKMLGKITGSGCMLTGIIAAFLGAGADSLTAAISGLTLYGAAGERAAEQTGARQPGTFRCRLIDALAELAAGGYNPKFYFQ